MHRKYAQDVHQHGCVVSAEQSHTPQGVADAGVDEGAAMYKRYAQDAHQHGRAVHVSAEQSHTPQGVADAGVDEGAAMYRKYAQDAHQHGRAVHISAEQPYARRETSSDVKAPTSLGVQVAPYGLSREGSQESPTATDFDIEVQTEDLQVLKWQLEDMAAHVQKKELLMLRQQLQDMAVDVQAEELQILRQQLEDMVAAVGVELQRKTDESAAWHELDTNAGVALEATSMGDVMEIGVEEPASGVDIPSGSVQAPSLEMASMEAPLAAALDLEMMALKRRVAALVAEVTGEGSSARVGQHRGR